MVSKIKKKTGRKKAPRTSPQKASRRAAEKAAKKKSAPRAAKKGAKKGAKKPARNAAKKTTRKATPASRAKKKASKNAGAATVLASDDADEVTLTLDELADVDDLVADAPLPAQPVATQLKKKDGPRTPTVPRAVKPTPKIADLDMDKDVLEFIEAVDAYRQGYCRPFPTWTEVFYLLRELGYRKSASQRP